MAEDNTIPADVIAETRNRLASFVPQLSIIRPGEFCDAATFLDGLPSDTVDFIAKVTILEPTPYQSGYSSQRSESELLKAIRLNSSTILDSSIALGSVAVKYVWKGDPNLGIVISMFGRALRRRWEVSKEDEHLDDAIYYFQKTVEIEPAEEANRALHFDDLGCALWERYTRRHEDNDFQASKIAFEAAAELPHSGKPMFLSNLGRLYKDKGLFYFDERTALMKQSFAIHLQAIGCATAEFRGSIRYLHRNLAITYLELYPISELDPVEAIEPTLKEQIEASGHRWAFLYEMGVIFGNKFISSGQLEDANKGIAFLRAALIESPDNKTVIITLADSLEQKGLSLRSLDVLAEACQLSEKAMDMTSEYSFEILSRLLSTSLIATRQFELSGDPKEIEKAVSLTQRALASALMGDARRWKFQQVLGIQLNYRFQATEKASDLEEAISSLQSAIHTEAEGLTDFDRGTNLREYGKVLFTRFKFQRKSEDFDGALQSFHKSIELFGPNNSSIIGAINDLGSAMTVKFESYGQLDDIRKAIEYHLEALTTLERFPLMIKAEKPMYYVGLGNAFYIKYEMWDQAADLNQSISYYEEAVKSTDSSDVRFGSRLGSLSRAQMQKFRVTHDKKLLLSAQDSLKSFLARVPPPSSQNVAYLSNILGYSYLHDYDNSDNDISFFDKAAESFQAAVDSGCTLPLLINAPVINLTRTILGKYSKTKSDTDLANALKQLATMQKFTGNLNNRELRGLLDTIGQFTTLLYDTRGLVQFGKMGITYYGQITKDDSAFSERRLWAYLQCARLIYEINKAPADARDVLVQAIQLLPEAVLMSPNRGDQLRAAKDVSALPGFLISFSLAAGDLPADVLLLYEQSRSLIWNRLLDLKTDLVTLREEHEELATKFEHLRITLSRASPQVLINDVSAMHRVQHHDLSNQYNETLRLIRREKGFERFLLLEEPARIIDHASQGPIVILNATKYRGDAIMVTPEGISTIMLPKFVFDSCVTEGANLQLALHLMSTDPESASSLFSQVLKWLWEAVASPVLDKLKLTGLPNEDQRLPRIWWVVNSWISLFPIHAAGDHARAKETGEPCTVIDRVISSYIPTLRALDYVRKSAAELSSIVKAHPNTAVLIKMPTTPDDQDLTNVSQEVESVEDILKPLFQVTALSHPRRKDVVPLLEQASVAHFACHGIADGVDPSLSKLKLQDWKTNPLDVRFLLRSSFKRLKLVYLSACETSLTKASKLQEESIHPSSAFQMVGVPYTIGSMWNIEDQMSVQIASNFYSYLATGQEDIDLGKSAEALHFAVVKARSSGVDPLLWGAFVHSGA